MRGVLAEYIVGLALDCIAGTRVAGSGDQASGGGDGGPALAAAF